MSTEERLTVLERRIVVLTDAVESLLVVLAHLESDLGHQPDHLYNLQQSRKF